jgi:hypothetical protein
MATRQRSQLNAVGGHSSMNVRRCPTLPQGRPCSTIGAASLSFRVRNVSGRFPRAMAAETLATPSAAPGWGGVVCGLGGPPDPVADARFWGGRGGAVLSCLCWVSVCWEPQSGREQSLGPLTRPFHEHVQTCVSVVIVKLSAY